MPRRGAWVDRLGYWGVTSLVRPWGSASQDILPTQEVFVGGGTPNRDRSPVKGTGGGRCANGCQIRVDCRSSLESGDDIVCGEGSGSEISSWDSPSSEESQSLQVSADFLCVYERED